MSSNACGSKAFNIICNLPSLDPSPFSTLDIAAVCCFKLELKMSCLGSRKAKPRRRLCIVDLLLLREVINIIKCSVAELISEHFSPATVMARSRHLAKFQLKRHQLEEVSLGLLFVCIFKSFLDPSTSDA